MTAVKFQSTSCNLGVEHFALEVSPQAASCCLQLAAVCKACPPPLNETKSKHSMLFEQAGATHPLDQGVMIHVFCFAVAAAAAAVSLSRVHCRSLVGVMCHALSSWLGSWGCWCC